MPRLVLSRLVLCPIRDQFVSARAQYSAHYNAPGAVYEIEAAAPMGSRYAAGRWCCASRRRDSAAALRYGGWQRRKVVTTIQPAVEFFGNSLAWPFLRMAPVATQMPVSANRVLFRLIVTTTASPWTAAAAPPRTRPAAGGRAPPSAGCPQGAPCSPYPRLWCACWDWRWCTGA